MKINKNLVPVISGAVYRVETLTSTPPMSPYIKDDIELIKKTLMEAGFAMVKVSELYDTNSLLEALRSKNTTSPSSIKKETEP